MRVVADYEPREVSLVLGENGEPSIGMGYYSKMDKEDIRKAVDDGDLPFGCHLSYLLDPLPT